MAGIVGQFDGIGIADWIGGERGGYDSGYLGYVFQVNHPQAEIVDPYAMFPDSVDYDRTRARQVLFEMGEEAASADIIIAYLPSASMGTALEMLRAYDNGGTILTISPMATNWFIWGLSKQIFSTLEEFCTWVRGVQLTDFIE